MEKSRSPHIFLAHALWKEHLRPGDTAIDATCGNGHDTVRLAQLLLHDPSSLLIGLDLQPSALTHTADLLNATLPEDFLKRVLLHRLSHEQIDEIPLPHRPRLIVYNLGYLPGGDKSLTTKTGSTMGSLQKAMKILASDGAISVTCYPGHDEGANEEKAILHWAQGLDPSEWQISYHRWINRVAAPSLFWIRKTESMIKKLPKTMVGSEDLSASLMDG